MAERTVNRFVVGSSPTPGAEFGPALILVVGRLTSPLVCSAADVEMGGRTRAEDLRRTHIPAEPAVNGSPIEVTVLHETDDESVVIH